MFQYSLVKCCCSTYDISVVVSFDNQYSYIAARKVLSLSVTIPIFSNIWSARISSSSIFQMWDKFTYPCPDVNDVVVEVWELISIFITHFTGHVNNYPWLKLFYFSENGPCKKNKPNIGKMVSDIFNRFDTLSRISNLSFFFTKPRTHRRQTWHDIPTYWGCTNVVLNDYFFQTFHC